MTFSICVRERYEGTDGEEHLRFGVAVTTRLACVGEQCPNVSEHGAVSTQSYLNRRLGWKGIEYIDDGLAAEDALRALLEADEDASRRQLHGVSADSEFAHSGPECGEWFGHVVADNYTVAGNLLAGEAVVEATAARYERSDPDRRLSIRLIDALAAGQAQGGDRRTERAVQSAALWVETSEPRAAYPYHDNLRVDATETPIRDLRETWELARRSFEESGTDGSADESSEE